MLPLALAACLLPASNPSGAVPEPLPIIELRPPEPAPVEIDLQIEREPGILAARLAEAERAVRDPSVDDATAGRWGHLQQRIYRTLAADRALADAVQAHIPPDLASVVARNLTGTGTIAKTVTKLRRDLPDWRIVEPDPIETLLGYYREAASAHDVPWTILASIHLNETRMGRLRGASPVGAQGPMQFMPQTWAAYGEGDVNDNRAAIRGAAHYLARMGWHDDPRRAIWHYNHSEDYIDAILAFASVMDEDERAFRGYWGWQVYYRTVRGSIWLEAGYDHDERVSIDAYCEPRGEPHCPG